MNDYQSFTTEQFAMDRAFQQWVQSPNEELNSFWQSYQSNHPEQVEKIAEARKLIQSTIFVDGISNAEKAEMWNYLESNMHETSGKVISSSIFNYRKLFKVAALFAGLALMIAAVYFNLNSSQKVNTQFGEIREVVLPDSSRVTLNAHSSVHYAEQFNKAEAREIWLEGEAFFSVKHTVTNQHFIVHAGSVDVEVLGTEFNVSGRKDKIRISLNSGKIKLSFPGTNKQPVLMKPGELVEVDAALPQFVKTNARVENYSAWKDHRLVFDDTPLSEVITQLKYIYDWSFEVPEQDLFDERLTGELDTDNEKQLLNELAKAMNLKIQRTKNIITIRRM